MAATAFPTADNITYDILRLSLQRFELLVLVFHYFVTVSAFEYSNSSDRTEIMEVIGSE